MDKLLLRPAEAADLLGVGRSKLYELLAGGVVPSVRLGRSLRIPADALRRWIEAMAPRLSPAPKKGRTRAR